MSLMGDDGGMMDSMVSEQSPKMVFDVTTWMLNYEDRLHLYRNLTEQL